MFLVALQAATLLTQVAPALAQTAPPPAAPAPEPDKKVDGKALSAAYKEGFVLQTDDKQYRLKLGGYLQADGRFFFSDEKDKLTHQFLGRRLRPILEGTVFKYFDFRFMPDFGLGKALVQDAWIDLHFVDAIRLRAGKMKEPFGLERLQSATALTFVERGLPTNLVPNRDFGVQLHGEVADGTLASAAGVFNGVPDGGSADGDVNDDKDVVARVFVRPFKPTSVKLLHDIGVGFAISWGQRDGKLDTPEVPQLKTPGQATFFSYRTGATLAETVVADGPHYRVGPQAYAYVGPAGLMFEHVKSTQRVRLEARSGDVTVWSWQLAGLVVITGEHPTYQGVTPKHPVGEGGYGAVALEARYDELNPKGEAFAQGFADAKKSADRIRSLTVGATYYFNRNVEVQVDFSRATFVSGAKDGDRPNEQVLLTRLQLQL
jgi:phosphate-selective porin OprO/OprP